MIRSVLAIALIAGIAVVAGTGCSKKTTTQSAASPVQTPAPSPYEWGYADPPAPPLEGTPLFRLISVGFDETSAELKPESMGACKEAAKRLRELPHAQVAAIGFADALKERQGAEDLGLRRAEATRGYLSTLGIPPEWVQVASYGARYSTAKENEKIKMGLERKVELWVVQ
jgi:outer membrane protein OmpA-like peptidoglycan-associated protein